MKNHFPQVLQDHSSHPGHNSGDCPCRQTVTAANSRATMNGYGCYMTGGHCVPSSDCNGRRADYNAQLLLAQAIAGFVQH